MEEMNLKENNNYYQAIGRRKTATARIHIDEKGNGKVEINNRPLSEYFPKDLYFSENLLKPLKIFNKNYDLKILVKGGGFTSQLEAIRLGIARALLTLFPDYKTTLKEFGLLKIDIRHRGRPRKGPRFKKR